MLEQPAALSALQVNALVVELYDAWLCAAPPSLDAPCCRMVLLLLSKPTVLATPAAPSCCLAYSCSKQQQQQQGAIACYR